MSNQEVYDYLREIHCCQLCCLRYFNGRADDYQNVEKSLESVCMNLPITRFPSAFAISNPLPHFQRDIKTSPDDVASKNGHVVDDVANDEIVPVKRSKPNVCIACLDIFSSGQRAEMLQQIDRTSIAEYADIPTVLASFSMPISLSLRALAVWIALLKRFPGKFSTAEPPDVPLKEVIKLIVNPQVCAQLGKQFEQNQNGLMVNVFYEHDDSAGEVRQLVKVNPKLFKNRSQAPR